MNHPAQLLGILNVTPDSFSDGGHHTSLQSALSHAQQLRTQGATWVDVGGESTRPGAGTVTADQEWARVKDVLASLVQTMPGRVSLDTYRAQNAERFLRLGGTIINDVSGAQDPHMRDVVAAHNATIIVNHFPGRTTAEVHAQSIDSPQHVYDDLLKRKQQLLLAGVSPQRIILDPGIGFGKTPELNWRLLTCAHDLPRETILIGHSKKRFLGEHRWTEKANIDAAKKALQAGTTWLRVHDPAWYTPLLLPTP